MTRARPRALRACLAVSLAVVLLAAGPGAAQAAPPGWEATAAAVAAPWPALQDAEGHFADYVVRRAPGSERDDYGDAMLGYGLLLEAARTGDERLRDSGLRAIASALRSGGSRANAPFRFMALAAAYNVARASFPHASLFAAERERWERVLRSVRLLRLGRGKPTNKTLVEAVEVLELARTGLRSTRRRAVLSDPGRAVARVERLLAAELPRAARSQRRADGALIGDFPGVPPAYHALASGFLARSIELLGAESPRRARRLLRRAADASWALAAPDGAVSYFGRSQEQAWTLPLTAYGAEVAATGSPRAGSYRALSERVFERLGESYGAGDEGFWITPALRADLRGGIRGLDAYAAAVPYNGLTLVGANWAIGAAGAATVPGALGADADGSFRLGRGDAAFATVRAGDVWFAVKQARSASADLRYDFGVVAIRVRGADGAWRALPLRPRTRRHGATAGPVLRRGGRRGLPHGRSLTVADDGTVTVQGGFRTRRGRTLRRALRFRFVPTACGVSMRLPARRADRYDYSAFFAGAPRSRGRSVVDGSQAVAFNLRARRHVLRRRASGAEPRLTEVRLRFAAPDGGTVEVESCAR